MLKFMGLQSQIPLSKWAIITKKCTRLVRVLQLFSQNLRMWLCLETGLWHVIILRWGHTELGWVLIQWLCPQTNSHTHLQKTWHACTHHKKDNANIGAMYKPKTSKDCPPHLYLEERQDKFILKVSTKVPILPNPWVQTPGPP